MQTTYCVYSLLENNKKLGFLDESFIDVTDAHAKLATLKEGFIIKTTKETIAKKGCV